jgi:hypothetical protein
MATSSGSIFWLFWLALAAFGFLWAFWSARDRPFDVARWNAPREKREREQRRLPMARWLVKKSTLLGKTRSEVVDMLGPPSDSFWFKDSDWECFDVYECSFHLDFLALGIKCDEKDVVIESAIVQA